MHKSAGIPTPRRTFHAALGRAYFEPPSVFTYFVPTKRIFSKFSKDMKKAKANGFDRYYYYIIRRLFTKLCEIIYPNIK